MDDSRLLYLPCSMPDHDLAYVVADETLIEECIAKIDQATERRTVLRWNKPIERRVTDMLTPWNDRGDKPLLASALASRLSFRTEAPQICSVAPGYVELKGSPDVLSMLTESQLRIAHVIIANDFATLQERLARLLNIYVHSASGEFAAQGLSYIAEGVPVIGDDAYFFPAGTVTTTMVLPFLHHPKREIRQQARLLLGKLAIEQRDNPERAPGTTAQPGKDSRNPPR